MHTNPQQHASRIIQPMLSFSHCSTRIFLYTTSSTTTYCPCPSRPPSLNFLHSSRPSRTQNVGSSSSFLLTFLFLSLPLSPLAKKGACFLFLFLLCSCLLASCSFSHSLLLLLSHSLADVAGRWAISVPPFVSALPHNRYILPTPPSLPPLNTRPPCGLHRLVRL